MPAIDAVENLEPLAVRQPLARQMRTTYARTDIDAPAPQEMGALVVGDPGGGNLSLQGAREEAFAVATVLRRHGIRVEAYIGSGDSPPTEGARSATRLDVLAKVLTGRYDLIHYAGHGVFDPEAPEMSGWLFAEWPAHRARADPDVSSAMAGDGQRMLVSRKAGHRPHRYDRHAAGTRPRG